MASKNVELSFENFAELKQLLLLLMGFSVFGCLLTCILTNFVVFKDTEIITQYPKKTFHNVTIIKQDPVNSAEISFRMKKHNVDMTLDCTGMYSSICSNYRKQYHLNYLVVQPIPSFDNKAFIIEMQEFNRSYIIKNHMDDIELFSEFKYQSSKFLYLFLVIFMVSFLFLCIGMYKNKK